MPEVPPAPRAKAPGLGVAGRVAGAGALAALRERLGERGDEIEQAVMTRIFALGEPGGIEEPQYAEGLSAATAAAIEYGLASIGRDVERIDAPPPVLLAQARLAARSGVSLDTVLRRYFAGYAILGDFIVAAAEARPRLERSPLQGALRALAALFDRLVLAISEEYEREVEARPGTSGSERRAALAQKLLAGEFVDVSGLAYELDAFHLALIAIGPGAPAAIRSLARPLDRRLLIVERPEETVWAWLGGRERLRAEDLEGGVAECFPADLRIAFGESGFGLAGWRFSHRQARAALPVALRGSKGAVRYADVAVIASIQRDEVLADTLHTLYVAPLEAERDGGELHRETLRAYFEGDRRVTSAAAALKLTRQTVRRRLQSVEELLGRPLERCGVELEIALRLADMGRSGSRGDQRG